MKKSSKTIAIAATFAVAMGVTSCVPPTETGKLTDGEANSIFNPGDDDVNCVYGPPEDFDPDDDNVQTEYEAPYFDEYDPEDDEVQDVYGPPPEEIMDDEG